MKVFVKSGVGLALLWTAIACRAMGMLPETGVVLVEEGKMTPFNLTNTDNHPLLLYTKIQTLPEDKAPLVVASPSVIRVEPNKVQTVNFLVNSVTPLTQQRLRRVIFVGIPPAVKSKTPEVRFAVQQNLPLIISPANLTPNNQPWKLLQWSEQNRQLSVHNPSPYVVRLTQTVDVANGRFVANLGQEYVLPGETLTVPITMPKGQAISAETKIEPLDVRVSPVGLYGLPAATYHSPLLEQAPTPSNMHLAPQASAPAAMPSPAKQTASAPAAASQ